MHTRIALSSHTKAALIGVANRTEWKGYHVTSKAKKIYCCSCFTFLDHCIWGHQSTCPEETCTIIMERSIWKQTEIHVLSTVMGVDSPVPVKLSDACNFLRDSEVKLLNYVITKFLSDKNHVIKIFLSC